MQELDAIFLQKIQKFLVDVNAPDSKFLFLRSIESLCAVK